MTRISTLALALVLAGCQMQTVPTLTGSVGVSLPSSSSASKNPNQAVATPVPRATPMVITPTPGIPLSVPSSGASSAPLPLNLPSDPQIRVMDDRPDEITGLQLHLLYFLPSDGEDQHLDTNGAIARSVAAANTFFATKTGGKRFRLDTIGGVPDVTFFRGSRPHRQMGATPEDWQDAMVQELSKAGFSKLNKVYVAYYGGGSRAQGSGVRVVGVGGSGYASVLLNQCVDCNLAASEQTPGTYEYTFLHETLHALGFVPACAPHVTDTSHVNNDPNDIMYAESTSDDATPNLDALHQDYFRDDDTDCLDLARSAFLAPLPARLQLPIGRPIALEAGQNPVMFKPTLPDVSGVDDAEAALFERLNSERQRRGLMPLTSDPGLVRLSRQATALLSTNDLAGTAAKVGFPGTCGMEALTTDARVADDAVVAQVAEASGFAHLVSDAALNRVGIGVTRTDSQTQVVLTYAQMGLTVDGAATLGEGLANSFTLAVPVLPTASGDGRAFVDGEDAGGYTFKAGERQFVYVSVPRRGKHEIHVGLKNGTSTKYRIELTYRVDGDAPLAQAFIP